MINTSIFILTGSNNKYGSGHAKRSTQLSNTLRKEGFDVTIENYYKKSWSEVLEAVKSNNFNFILLDLPIYYKKIISYFKGKKVIALDYFGNDYIPLTISVYKHKVSKNNGIKLFGVKYAIIRSDLLKYRFKNNFLTKSVNNILIMMGSLDLGGYGRKIAYTLSKNFNVTLIEGGKNYSRKNS